ncbi:MAG: GNAT family N-acetyltransferase [Acidobacteria bacterium]|nr:GNAT family N-acetyltransferase [Acidobacteriota bacterium]
MIVLPVLATVPQAAAPDLRPPPDTGAPEVRLATVGDAPFIHGLIARYQHAGHLLPRSPGDTVTHASRFVVAIKDGTVLACAELAPLSRGVAEVRSLVVDEAARGLGVGRMVIEQLRRRARSVHYGTLCAFTHDPRFFVRLGFSIVPHSWLPEKVSADCWSCALFQKCGQYAMVDTRVGPRPATAVFGEIFS